MLKHRKNQDDSAMDRTNIERDDQSMRGDSMAGSEGIDEPSMHEHNRMSTSDRGRGNRQQGREGSTDDASDFGGMGGQRENVTEREGTGYTGDRDKKNDKSSRGDGSTTDQSESENPLT